MDRTGSPGYTSPDNVFAVAGGGGGSGSGGGGGGGTQQPTEPGGVGALGVVLAVVGGMAMAAGLAAAVLRWKGLTVTVTQANEALLPGDSDAQPSGGAEAPDLSMD